MLRLAARRVLSVSSRTQRLKHTGSEHMVHPSDMSLTMRRRVASLDYFTSQLNDNELEHHSKVIGMPRLCMYSLPLEAAASCYVTTMLSPLSARGGAPENCNGVAGQKTCCGHGRI